MWSLALSVLSWVLSLFGFGKPDPYKQGVAAGQSQATASDALGELADVKKASDARAAVSDDASDILSDSANAGPVQPSQRG